MIRAGKRMAPPATTFPEKPGPVSGTFCRCQDSEEKKEDPAILETVPDPSMCSRIGQQARFQRGSDPAVTPSLSAVSDPRAALRLLW